MSIQFNCPSGHTLRVKDKYAGKTGVCPYCHTKVVVPKLSEEAILSFLSAPGLLNDVPPSADAESMGAKASDSLERLHPAVVRYSRETKTCSRCRKEVPSAYHLCPHCSTYFADNSEIVRRLKAS